VLGLKKYLFKLGGSIIALIALAGAGDWSVGDFAASLQSQAVARSCLGAENETPGTVSRLNTAQIRYSQSTYSLYGKTDEGELYSVAENVQWLKDHPDQELPWGGPIRVFRKQRFMDEWGPLSQAGYTGEPKNLVNGEIYTLDHRRLVAYQRAGRNSIPVQWASLSVVRDNRWKFSTSDGGRSIAPKP
jgi:hypothetical protein